MVKGGRRRSPTPPRKKSIQPKNPNEIFEVSRRGAPDSSKMARRGTTSIAPTEYSTRKRARISTNVLPHGIPAASPRTSLSTTTENVARGRTSRTGTTAPRAE